MSAKERETLYQELRTIVYRLVDSGMLPDDIRQHWRVKELLRILYPSRVLIARSHKRIIRVIIQQRLTPEGARDYNYLDYLEQLDLGVFDDDTMKNGPPREKRTRIYARLEAILANPDWHKELLRVNCKRHIDSVMKCGVIKPTAQIVLTRYLRDFFDQLILEVDQPVVADIPVLLEDVRKDIAESDDAAKGVDKTGGEAGADDVKAVNE